MVKLVEAFYTNANEFSSKMPQVHAKLAYAPTSQSGPLVCTPKTALNLLGKSRPGDCPYAHY